MTVRVTYSMNVSLDGYINDPDGSLDWSTINDEVHGWFNREVESAGAIVYGRRLYDVMTAYWPTAHADPEATPVTLEFARVWNAQRKVVFSHSLENPGAGWELLRGPVEEAMPLLASRYHGELQVAGPNLAGQFIRAGLVDEYRLMVHPVVLGGGTPFFPSGTPIRDIALAETVTLTGGVVLLRYVRS